MDIKFAISILGLAFALSIRAESATPGKSVSTAYSQVRKQNGAQLLTEVIFQEGKSDLTEDARVSLRGLLDNAAKEGKIAEVAVVSWSDKEYPASEVRKLSPDDRRLADDRLATIKDYIATNSGAAEVRTFNMAEQPDGIEKYLNTSPNVKMKSSLEVAGLAHPSQTGMPQKASHAMVLVTLR